jgi:N-acetylglucosaminyl-diphospho-decaprenol L-rhamnosyltransferase
LREILVDTEGGPGLSVVITNYEGKGFLRDCLSSIHENLKAPDVETIVVDNASSDGSPEYIRENFPWVRLICNRQNLGYAKANNQGIMAARGESILLLNPDTVVSSQAIDLLRDELRQDLEVGAVGPALLAGGNRYQVSFGREISFCHEVLQKGLLNPYFRRNLKNMKKKREVGWLSGACILARKRVLEEAGLFDEDFFLFFEDIDLCRRIRENGWKLIFLPEAKIFHAGGGITARLKKSSLYYYRKSQLAYYAKNSSGLSIFLLRLYLRINFALLFVFDRIKRDENKKFTGTLFELLRKE